MSMISVKQYNTFLRYRWKHFCSHNDAEDYIYRNKNKDILIKASTVEKGNDIIRKGIESNQPYFMIRPGKSEYMSAYWWDHHCLFNSNNWLNCGSYKIHKDKHKMERYINRLKEDISYADTVCTFPDYDFVEHYLVEQYSNAKSVVDLLHIDALKKDSWIRSLDNKKVLIVSPFTELIKEQYNNMSKIWGGYSCIPLKMNLVLVQSVWYLGDGKDEFESWFEAAEYLLNEVKKREFDIALLSCGSFSTYLGSEIKKMGKKAIQYGGALQMLFGIKGKRWDDSKFYSKFFNEYWVRPQVDKYILGRNSDEIGDFSKQLDDNCYF